MLLPPEIEHKLGFDRLRQWLTDCCDSKPGVEYVQKMVFTTDHAVLKKHLDQSDEYYRILLSGETLPLRHIDDVREHLKHARTEGTFLEPEDFMDISRTIDTAAGVVNFLSSRNEEYPNLFQIVAGAGEFKELGTAISNVLTDDGNIRDQASPELRRIRKGLNSGRINLRKSLDSIFREAMKNGYVPEKASVTVRDGRMVIPVLAEYKRRIRGFIHDESATGQTVYLEPAAVLEGNNEIRELEYAEKREVLKILRDLTDIVRPQIPSILQTAGILGLLDFIRAKARLARELEATRPPLLSEPSTKLNNARHPLLFLNFKKTKRNVIPSSLRLDNGQRIIIISGPNAGGKSVCLKTVGLIQYMWQCGLLVPADEDSKLGIFSDIFIDIGDEQSIENDLSTYSSHLTLMKNFLHHSGSGSLILIDEFGTGTDPQFGGAIAESILEEFLSLGCLGIITTHYGNIKSFAQDHSSITNGAMKYDVERLEPLYELQLGTPGSSFSFEVARKIGLPGSIIEHARQLLGEEKVNVDELIVALEKQERLLKERDDQLREKEQVVKSLEMKYESLYSDLQDKKAEIIGKARDEASSLLKESNREIEKTIRHIRENKANKAETQRARKNLESLRNKVQPVVVKDEKSATVPVELKPGDMVQLRGGDVVGEVLSIRRNNAELKVGSLKTIARIKDLEKVSRKEAKKVRRTGSAGSSNVDMSEKLAGFTRTLDVRGKRGNEVLGMVDKFVDDGLLFNASELRILHGKGDGILRKLIREHLRNNRFVKTMKDAHIEQGGAGITVVEIK